MHGDLIAREKVADASIRAVVTRADGSTKDYGIISYYSRNWIKHYSVNAWIKLKELCNGRSRTE